MKGNRFSERNYNRVNAFNNVLILKRNRRSKGILLWIIVLFYMGFLFFSYSDANDVGVLLTTPFFYIGTTLFLLTVFFANTRKTTTKGIKRIHEAINIMMRIVFSNLKPTASDKNRKSSNELKRIHVK